MPSVMTPFLEEAKAKKPVTEEKVFDNPWDLYMIPNHFRINGTLFSEEKWKATAELTSKDKTIFPGCKVTSSDFSGEGTVAAIGKVGNSREIWVRRPSGYHITVAETAVKKVNGGSRYEDVRLRRRDGSWEISKNSNPYPMYYGTAVFDLKVTLSRTRDIETGDRVDVVNGVLRNGLVIAKHGSALWVIWSGMSEPSTYTADRLKHAESVNV